MKNPLRKTICIQIRRAHWPELVIPQICKNQLAIPQCHIAGAQMRFLSAVLQLKRTDYVYEDTKSY